MSSPGFIEWIQINEIVFWSYDVCFIRGGSFDAQSRSCETRDDHDRLHEAHELIIRDKFLPKAIRFDANDVDVDGNFFDERKLYLCGHCHDASAFCIACFARKG